MCIRTHSTNNDVVGNHETNTIALYYIYVNLTNINTRLTLFSFCFITCYYCRLVQY